MYSRGNRLFLLLALSVLLSIVSAVIVGCSREQVEPATVVSTSPDDGATGVPVTPPRIQMTFSEPVDRAAVEESLRVSPSEGDRQPEFQWSEDGRVLTVVYSEPFQPGTEYQVEVAQANGEPSVQPYSLEFTTTSETAVGAGPASSGNLSFAKDIKPLADARCANCHKGAMSDYNSLISKNLVKPGNASGSPYYTKGIGQAGHPGGNVWKDRADLVRRWIAAGAPK